MIAVFSHNDQYQEPWLAANQLRQEDDASIISVGVFGMNGVPLFDYNELLYIAGNNSGDVFRIRFTEMYQYVDKIINRFPCKSKCASNVLPL